ncbi:MAG TPA: PilZ domain-containing protein [Planctomycetota bacterium]
MEAERRKGSRKRPPEDARVSLRAKGVVGNLAKKVVDWSAGGACLVTSERLRPGAKVDVSISGGGVKIRALASVRWSTTLTRGDKSAHVCGLELREPAPKRKVDPNRRHRRFGVKDVAETECKPETWLSLLGMGRTVSASVRDLSGGGIRLAVSRKLKVGDRLRLRVVFTVPNTVLEAEGMVRWCKRDTLSLKPQWDVGVVFRRVNDEMALRRVEKHFGSAP